MASKIRNYKNNKEKIEQIFKAYLICKFKIENNFVSGEELQKSMLFYKQVEFILSNIGDDAQYLKDAFINKKRWYEFRESKASFFRKMNNAIISFNNYYGSISTI